MKKISAFALLLILSISFAYSEKYKIAYGNFKTQGRISLTTTKPYILEMNFPLDKKTIFTKEEFDLYINNYEQEIINSRFFEEIEVTYSETGSTENSKTEEDEEEIILVAVNVSVVDSNHFLMVPYAKFKDDSSETKFLPKLKAKDTNFLGTMNSLSTDLNVEVKKVKEDGFWTFEPGFNLSYDYPFKAGPFELTWVNDYGLDFTFGKFSPEWDAKTGLKAEYKFERVSLVLEAYQTFNRETDYIDFDDELYFENDFKFSVPFVLHKFSNYSPLTYTPAVEYKFYWDFDSINEYNLDLKGPEISFSHQLSNSKVNWENNYRKGYSLSLKNDWTYNFFTKDWSPSIELEGKYFNYVKLEDRKSFDKVGLTVDFYAFTYLPFPSNVFDPSNSGYGNKIGDRIRGITDDSYFGNEYKEYTSSTAMVLNIDVPVNIFNTSFKHEIINFDLQLSPFVDIAIFRDRALPLQTNSVICCGGEVLVYPRKWSSFTIRASLGFDIKGAISENNVIKGLLHNKEFSIGLGLHY